MYFVLKNDSILRVIKSTDKDVTVNIEGNIQTIPLQQNNHGDIFFTVNGEEVFTDFLTASIAKDYRHAIEQS